MNNIIERVWKRDSMVNIEDLRGSAFQNEKAGHTFIISGIDGDGNAISLSGTVAGSFLRPDGTTVAIVGYASDGRVYVTLPENCYDVPGKFWLTIFLTENNQTTAIYAAIGAVARTSSSTAAPGTTADVATLVNAIETAISQIPASYTNLESGFTATNVPAEWSPNLKKGEYIKVADGSTASSNKYARTNSLWNGYGYRIAVALSNANYEFCIAYYDSTGQLDGTGYIGHSGYIMGIGYVPEYAKLIGVSFRRIDQTNLSDSDIDAISAALSVYTPTDTTLTLAGMAADAKTTGDRLKACVRGTGLYFNSDNPASAPYDDLDTIPTNEIVSYGSNDFPSNMPSDITLGTITVITFSRGTTGEYTSLWVQLIAHRRQDGTIPAELYMRMSYGSTPGWTAWEKVARSSVVEPWLDSLQAEVDELSNKNQFAIKTSNSISMREATTTSNTDGTIKINGAVTSSELYRSYTTNDNIGDNSAVKDIQLKAGVRYSFGYEYVSGTLNREDVLLMAIINSSSASTVYASVNVCEADSHCEFSVNTDTTVRIRVYVEKNTTYTNYIVKPYLVVYDDSDIVITPSMFSRIAVIGDSFASGISGEEGTAYEYSWLQMMAREYGCTGENFSSGGLTTRTWLTNSNGLAKLQSSDPCNLYFVALGINDSNPDSRNVPVGVITDMDEETPPDTFYGNNKKIRDAILAKNEHAVICYITPMRVGSRYIPYQDAVAAMANKYGCLLIDWRDVPYNNGTWWNDNLVSNHPRVPMYNAMMHSVSELLNKSIQNNMTYMRPYPNVVNT